MGFFCNPDKWTTIFLMLNRNAIYLFCISFLRYFSIHYPYLNITSFERNMKSCYHKCKYSKSVYVCTRRLPPFFRTLIEKWQGISSKFSFTCGWMYEIWIVLCLMRKCHSWNSEFVWINHVTSKVSSTLALFYTWYLRRHKMNLYVIDREVVNKIIMFSLS